MFMHLHRDIHLLSNHEALRNTQEKHAVFHVSVAYVLYTL